MTVVASARARRAEARPGIASARAPAPATPAPANPTWSLLGLGAVPLQAKLRIGAADDPLEREADRVADAVVSGAPPAVVRRKCAACAEEEVQAKRGSGAASGGGGGETAVAPRTAARIAGLRGGGEPLTPVARGYFEPRFGRDLSAVRLHTGAEAAMAAGEVGARALTVGSDVAFAAGEHRPETAEGRRLIAHELVHTVQQGTSRDRIQRDHAPGASPQPVAAPDLSGPLTDDEWQQLALGQSRGEVGSDPLTEDLQHNALVVAEGIFCSRSLLVEGVLDDPLLCVLPEVTRADPRVQQLAVHVGSLLNRGGPGSWLEVFREDSPSPDRGGLRRLALAAVGERVRAVTVPTESGHLAWQDRRRGPGGYVYRALSEGAEAHREYVLGGEEVLGLSGPRDLRRWRIFEFVMRTEGDTSAINAWDEQQVSIGAGFSAHSRQAQAVFNRMPEQFRQRLFEHGIEVGADDSLTVLDVNRGVLAEGDDAYLVLRGDENRLSLLIRLAQSEETMTENGEERSIREWMLRAQFEQLQANVEDDILDEWPEPTATLAVKMHHWLPGVATWRALRLWSGGGADVHAMARGARDAIWRNGGMDAEGSYSLSAIESRFQRRARALHLPLLNFDPRPDP